MKGLPYFYVEAPGERVTLSKADAAHASGPLRLRPGAEITVSDGRGWVARGRLGDGGEVEVADARTIDVPWPRLRVALAPPSGDRAWWAVQKLTELGVDEIALVESSRSVRRHAGKGEQLRRRARAVAREAAKQSRRPFLPDVVVTEGGLFEGAPDEERSVVLYEDAADPLTACLLGAPAPLIGLYVGPEGGLDDADLAEAKDRGAALASLGEPNLRTETAAIAAATIALSRYGRLG